MKSESSGRVVPKTCKSWLCPTCNVWLREGARKMILSGALDRPDGFDLALLTFTDTTEGALDLAGLYDRHKATVRKLEREYGIAGYCTAVEFQKRGALHPHIMCHWPLDQLDLLPEHGQTKRNREQYRFHFNELVPLAQDLGWGPVCDARAAIGRPDLASYAVKQLAGYATKEAYRKFKAAGAKRIRPLRRSKTWSDKRLREWQRGDQADPGPWLDVSQLDGGWQQG